MKYVKKVVNANLNEIDFTENLKDAIGKMGGVQANVVKEIVLDRTSGSGVKKAALPGLKKKHSRVYKYTAAHQTITLLGPS